MFKIYDGREQFYQWDIDRKLTVEDNTIKEVHFCNRTDTCSLVCETYEADGQLLVDVPNILLTTNWNINVYAFTGDYTKHNEVFSVVARTKPTDYIYTETEVKSVEAVVDEALNSVAGEVVESILAEQLGEYITETELEGKGYQTASDVNEAISTALEDVGGGGGEGYILNYTNSPSASEKAFLEELYAYWRTNGVLKPVDIYYSFNSGNNKLYYKAIAIHTVSNNAIYIYCVNKVDGLWKGIYYKFAPATNKYVSCSYYSEVFEKKWRWLDAFSNTELTLGIGGNSTQIKAVGYWNDDTSEIATYTISTSHGNSFSTELGTRYTVAEPRVQGGVMCFQNTMIWLDDDYTVEDNAIIVSDLEYRSIDGFVLLGFYYWG